MILLSSSSSSRLFHIVSMFCPPSITTQKHSHHLMFVGYMCVVSDLSLTVGFICFCFCFLSFHGRSSGRSFAFSEFPFVLSDHFAK